VDQTCASLSLTKDELVMTRTSTITRERVLQVLDYDREASVFTWRHRTDVRKNWNTRYAGDVAGTVRPDGYTKITIDYVQLYAHQIVWLIETGNFVEKLDHDNTDRSDNRIANLRPADNAQNAWNTGKPKNNTTGYKGVSVCKRTGKFLAQITVRGKCHRLGRYLTAEEAYEAYCKAAAELHGEFARTG